MRNEDYATQKNFGLSRYRISLDKDILTYIQGWNIPRGPTEWLLFFIAPHIAPLDIAPWLTPVPRDLADDAPHGF